MRRTVRPHDAVLDLARLAQPPPLHGGVPQWLVLRVDHVSPAIKLLAKRARRTPRNLADARREVHELAVPFGDGRAPQAPRRRREKSIDSLWTGDRRCHPSERGTRLKQG